MNILLDAYFDQNYGDDIFVETITGMFSNCKFYSFLEYYPPQICNWAEQIPNLYLLPECNVFLQKNMFDAYFCVGGDIFPDKGDYSKRKAYVESVKQGNGIVAFLGFSLFHEYCAETQLDIIELMKEADVIAPRDERSVAVLQQMLQGKEIQSMADLAFSSTWPIQSEENQKASNLLGISVRRPNYANDNSMAKYCRELRNVITTYLQENEHRKVRMFSLSDGSSADAEVVETILQDMPDRDRIEHFVYSGNSEEIKDAIGHCDMMICTRLHAMISCIAMNIPFLPIVYEVKMEHILEEICYTGTVFSFERLQGIREALCDLTKGIDGAIQGGLWDKKRMNEYLNRTEQILDKVYCMLGVRKESPRFIKKDTSGANCQEKEYGKKRAEEVSTQQSALEECQRTIAQYLKTLEECNRRNGEYFALIEELNQNISKLSQERDCKETMLQTLSPYLASGVGRCLTKVAASVARTEGGKANWKAVRQYFSKKTVE